MKKKKRNPSDRHAVRMGIYQIQRHVNRILKTNRHHTFKKAYAVKVFCKHYKLKFNGDITNKKADPWIIEKYRDEDFDLIGKHSSVRPRRKGDKKKGGNTKREAWKKRYHEYLKSPEWDDIRTEIHISRGGKCERCESTKQLQVHHLTYKNIFNEEPEDLELLCRKCHKLEHNK